MTKMNKLITKLILFILVAITFTNCKKDDAPVTPSLNAVGTWSIATVKGSSKSGFSTKATTLDNKGNGEEVTFTSTTYSMNKDFDFGDLSLNKITNAPYTISGSDLKLEVLTDDNRKAFVYAKITGTGNTISIQFTKADYIRGFKESPAIKANEVALFEALLEILDVTTTFNKKP